MCLFVQGVMYQCGLRGGVGKLYGLYQGFGMVFAIRRFRVQRRNLAKDNTDFDVQT